MAGDFVSREILTGRPLRLLYSLYTQSKPVKTRTVQTKQRELAEKLGISRQALNVHLRKLRNLGCIRTGRGFIDITEEGLRMLGVSVSPAFVFVRVSSLKRSEVYQKMAVLPVQQIFRVAGDMDAVLFVERTKLDEVLRKLALIEGIQGSKTYIATQTLK